MTNVFTESYRRYCAAESAREARLVSNWAGAEALVAGSLDINARERLLDIETLSDGQLVVAHNLGYVTYADVITAGRTFELRESTDEEMQVFLDFLLNDGDPLAA